MQAKKTLDDYIWIVMARMAILGVVLFAASFEEYFPGTTYLAGADILFAPVALLFAFSAASIIWGGRRGVGKGFAVAQLSADYLFLSIATWATGGTTSPIVYLNIPLVFAGALLLRRTFAIAFAVLVSATSIGITLSLKFGVITPAHELLYPRMTTPELLLQGGALAVALLSVAIFGVLIARRMQIQVLTAEEQERDLESLERKHSALMENLHEGIIQCSSDGEIVHLNDAALKLFSVEQDWGKGRTITELCSSIGLDVSSSIFSGVAEASSEVSFYNRRTKEDLKLLCSSRPVFDHEQQQVGFLFIAQDVTHIRAIEEQLSLQEKMAELRAKSSRTLPVGRGDSNFIGSTPVMLKVFQLIERVANSDATLLVTGESGTGKELVARSVHDKSKRADKPFIAVNCGAIPENLIESELFGHKRGAFTGAVSDHAGLLRRANGGTVFLDEIGELPLHMQAKLLRALQERSVRPVGSSETMEIDIRIVAATNKNLKDEIEKGNFREDLYYRLNVISIQLPPLRSRKDDIPALVDGILKRAAGGDSEPAMITPSALQALMSYSYPGNVRELENIIERALVLGGEAILPEHLPRFLGDEKSAANQSNKKVTEIIFADDLEFPCSLDEILSSIERRYLEIALVRADGVKKKAAQLLGINFRSFRYRLQKFEISADD